MEAYQRAIEVVRRANEIAAGGVFDEFVQRALTLCIELARAEGGTLFLYQQASDELVLAATEGLPHGGQAIGTRVAASSGIAGAALRSGEPFFSQVAHDEPLDSSVVRSVCCLPLLQHQAIGIVELFNMPTHTPDDLALLQLCGNCLVNEIEKIRLLQEAQVREKRLGALVDIISRLTTTLDRDELLAQIMSYARDLLNVEATSVWELDEQRDLLVLHVATGEQGAKIRQTTVPVGEGFIGQAVARGENVLVQDAEQDARHYRKLDEQTGFVTRSVLTVPLRSPNIQLGERGQLSEAIIGGAQAVNKLQGSFTADDVALFEALAGQAATVLRLERQYSDTQKLLIGMIKALAEAVDARDRHNQEHSRRVSEFSVAIAEELQLSRSEIYHVRLGSLLHDIGKIGVPDAVLDKPAQLNEDELAEMQSHTTKGYDILSQQELRWLLREELPALLQHHERLDGHGYPHGLHGADITQIGRIVAVADVFDALTSERPYKPGWSVEQALAYLQERKGTEFDAACVEAIVRARAAGKISTQKEQLSAVGSR